MSKTKNKQTTPPKIPTFWYYLLIIAVSLVANWFIQLTYFMIKINHNPYVFSGERTLADYTTGFIGDAVLLPIMNAAILFVILRSKIKFTRKDWLIIVLIGLAADVLLHFLQGYLRLTNWSMPTPYHWDFVSYWHMVSFFFQISFVFLFFYIVIMQRFKHNARVMQAICLVFGLMGLFIVLFLHDYVPMHLYEHTIAAKAAAFVLHR